MNRRKLRTLSSATVCLSLSASFLTRYNDSRMSQLSSLGKLLSKLVGSGKD